MQSFFDIIFQDSLKTGFIIFRVIENSSRLVAPTSSDLSHLFLDGLKVVAALQMNSLGCLFDVSVKMTQKS